MTDFEIYVGEDFALLMSAMADESNTPEDLTNFEVTAQLSTTTLGQKVIASTIKGKGIDIARRDSSNFVVNLPHDVTSQLSEGVFTLSVMLIEKATGAQIIAETKTINVKRSRLTI